MQTSPPDRCDAPPVGVGAIGNAFRKPFTGRAIAYTSTASFFNRFMFIKVISSIICIAFL